MIRKISIAAGLVLVLGGLVLYSLLGDGGVIGVVVIAFWVAIAVGIVIRFVRARRGDRVRDAFGPVASAGDTYQSKLLGRPSVAETRAEAKQPMSKDKYTTGE